MRRLRVFLSTLKEGFSGVWKHRSMGIASITSITLALIILGVITIATLTMNQAVIDVQAKIDEVDIMLDEGISIERIEELRKLIENNQDIASYEFLTSKDNMDQFREMIDVDDFMLEGMEDAFPPSFIIHMEDIAKTDKFVRSMKNEEGIYNIRYYQDVIEKIVKISHYVQYGGIIAVSILVLISILIISNTIKLTVLARRKEIQIKKYIGASNPVITNPFIVEGLLFGLFGSMIAFVTIYFGYEYFFEHYGKSVFNLLSTYLVEPRMIYRDILKIFLALGIGIGSLGSLLSIRRYLNV